MKKPIDPAAARLRREAAAARRIAELEERRRQRHGRLCGEYYEYTKDVRTNAMLLAKYIMGKWFKGSEADRQALLAELRKSDAPFLAANNPEARTHFYHAWRYNLWKFAFGKRAYLVTLAPRRYVLPIGDAASFDIFALQSWVRAVMRGFDYVGIVEAAHYSEANIGSGAGAQISFHVHLIVITANPRLLDERMAEINSGNLSLVPGRPCADAREIGDMDHGMVSKYMIKEPTNDYRIYSLKDELDDEFGICRKVNTDKSMQKKKRLSSGVQLRIRRVTRGWYLDKMIFAGGIGQTALTDIRFDALCAMPHSKRNCRLQEYAGCFEGDDPYVEIKPESRWVEMDAYVPPKIVVAGTEPDWWRVI